MIALRRKLCVNIKVVNTNWLRVFRQLDVIEVRALLLDVVDDDQVVCDLHLVHGIAFLDLDALTVFESHLWIQLVDEDFTCLGAQMQHYGFVIQCSDQNLMFIPPVTVQASWKGVVWVCTAVDLEICILARVWSVKHFQVFVEYSWCYRNISECLSCAFPKTKGLLPKAHFDSSKGRL